VLVLYSARDGCAGEVQSVEGRIAPLEGRHHSQRLGVMIEAAAGCEAAIERALAGMPEGGMAEIVGERQRLGQILVETERAGERARDLGDLEGVGQPGAKMIPFVEDEDLGLVRESAKRGGVDDAV